jgi:hypothetical protein
MTLENVLRGSGDIGAMAATVWGLSQVNAETNTIFVQNVKCRDFAPSERSLLKEGRRSIKRGTFELIAPPGFAGSLGDHKSQGGRPPMADKGLSARERENSKSAGMSVGILPEEIGVGSACSGWVGE